MDTISKHNILSWIPSPIDTFVNKRNGPNIIEARKRISGRWSHNRFFNYHYTPSPEYFKHILKHKIPAYTKKIKL